MKPTHRSREAHEAHGDESRSGEEDARPIDPSARLDAGAQRLVDEVRAEVPAIDWSRVESRLFDEHGDVRDAAPNVVRGRFARVATALAIAASFVVALAAPSRSPVAATTQQVAGRAPIIVTSSLGARALHVGDTFEAGDSGASLSSAGRLSAHLTPKSRLRVVEDGERILLSLDEGTIAAEVSKVAGGEPFAVDVGGRRVAVHGTRLVIGALRELGQPGERGVLGVAVTEGCAVVGLPHGSARTEGPVVPAGAFARFDRDDVVIARDADFAAELVDRAMSNVASSSPLTPAGATPHADDASNLAGNGAPSPLPIATGLPLGTTRPPPDALPPGPIAAPASASDSVVIAPAATTAAAMAPPGLSAEELAPSLAKAAAAVTACRLPSSMPVSIATTMTLSIDPTGAIGDPSFDPSLSPELMNCARGKLAGLRFPVAKGATVASRGVTFTSAKK